MRSNRNPRNGRTFEVGSIDDWEMRSNRNIGILDEDTGDKYRRLGNAL